MMRKRKARPAGSLLGAGLALSVCIATIPWPVSAYVGPGAGLSALGALLALLAAVVVAIFGFFWYPIKRMLNKRRPAEGQLEPDPNPDPARPREEPRGDDV